ncbi:transmembrane protein 107 isoform X2 [Cebus imitator]|uniref:transmembrane protein 107 isoform X2 n=1 Tax=Cebus imitator TaxID=2715852 RepID=UPI000809E55C|nr:transmembrane protein 107 isoform X2 [Cebus imitator]
MYCSREVFRERGAAPAYTITKVTGRCLSGREGGVRLDFVRLRGDFRSRLFELPASETAAPVPEGHGPGLRARTFSLSDAPGASGGRHHLILVPGQQHPGLPASQVHPRGVREGGHSVSSLRMGWLVAALSVTLGLFAVELAGFLLGVSMFNSTQSLISIGAHCSASVALSFFIFERWECTTYCALPAVTEMALFIAIFGLKKKPF